MKSKYNFSRLSIFYFTIFSSSIFVSHGFHFMVFCDIEISKKSKFRLISIVLFRFKFIPAYHNFGIFAGILMGPIPAPSGVSLPLSSTKTNPGT